MCQFLFQPTKRFVRMGKIEVTEIFNTGNTHTYVTKKKEQKNAPFIILKSLITELSLGFCAVF